MQVVVRGLQDSEAKVRAQAAFAVGQLAEYCQPDINDHYQQLLPGIFHVMHDPTRDVQQQACYALDVLCENLCKCSPVCISMDLWVMHDLPSILRQQACYAVGVLCGNSSVAQVHLCKCALVSHA